jgi:Zn-dependent protease with chaperone function
MSHAIAWMLTYLLHSTLLLGLAALFAPRLARRSLKLEEAVWRFALLAGLVTASVQVAAGYEPLAGRFDLAAGPAVASKAAEASPAVVPAAPRFELAAAAAAPEASPAVPSPAPRLAGLGWPEGALAAWGLGALLLAGGVAFSWARLSRRLRARPRVVGGNLFSIHRRLVADAGLDRPVRLSVSWWLPVPVAFGREVCVPPRALAALDADAQEGMLAHELAHIVRGDGRWLAATHLVASVLFFQPLNWVARRRLRQISELLCDEWAVARTGRPLSLARCLAEVAGWSMGVRPLPAPGMAAGASGLGGRIRRLLDEGRSPERPVRPRWLVAGVTAAALIVVAVAPGVSASGAAEPPAVPKAPRVAAAVPAPPPAPAPTLPKTPRALQVALDEEDLAELRAEGFTEEEIRELEANLRKTEEIVRSLEPEIERITEEATRLLEQNPELQRLQEEMEALAERMQPNREELERLSEEMARRAEAFEVEISEQEIERLTRRAHEMSERGELPSKQEIEEISREARELADRMRPSEQEIERLSREARELAERFRPTEEEMKALQEAMVLHSQEMGRLNEEVMKLQTEELKRIQLQIQEQLEPLQKEIERQLRKKEVRERNQVQERREERRSEPPAPI